MNGLPYYHRYPRDMIEGTRGMSFDERAAYGLVLDFIYLYSGKLPDDPRYIAGLLGLSVRRWNAIRERLISLGKLQIIGGLLTNYRADKEIIKLGKYLDKQAENGRQPKKNKWLEKPPLGPNSKPDGSIPNTNTNIEGREERISNDILPPPPVGGGGFSDDDFDKLLAAVGYDPDGHIPAPWFPDSPVIVAWLERLTSAQIIAAAKASREVHAEPPATPQALNSFMDQAAAKPAAKPRPTDAQIMAAQAARINGPGFCAASLVTPSQARALIDAGLVTSEKLSERGIAA